MKSISFMISLTRVRETLSHTRRSVQNLILKVFKIVFAFDFVFGFVHARVHVCGCVFFCMFM